jgi:hypothetical protein
LTTPCHWLAVLLRHHGHGVATTMASCASGQDTAAFPPPAKLSSSCTQCASPRLLSAAAVVAARPLVHVASRPRLASHRAAASFRTARAWHCSPAGLLLWLRAWRPRRVQLRQLLQARGDVRISPTRRNFGSCSKQEAASRFRSWGATLPWGQRWGSTGVGDGAGVTQARGGVGATTMRMEREGMSG